MGQSLILIYCAIPSFEVSADEMFSPRRDVMLEDVFLGVPLESQMVSVWVGANREDLVWEDRNRERREESGNAFCLPPPEYRVKVVVATASLSLSASAAGGLHTWGTPSPPISCPGRNSAETFLHATRHRMPSFIVSCAGKHECNWCLNANTFPYTL